MTAFIIILSILIVCAIIAAVIYGVHLSTQKKHDDFVLHNSIALKQINEINSRYEFFPRVNFDQHNTYDNEKIYDGISCQDYLIYTLQDIDRSVVCQINKIKANKKMYAAYTKELKDVNEFGRFDAPIGKMNLEMLKKREAYFIEKMNYHDPMTNFSIKVTIFCSKINGRIYGSKSQVFTDNDIMRLIERVNDKNGYFFNDRGVWDAICRVERGKVSNKMRFAIYARDGYRCCKCGVSDLNAQLEIDHIIPISKGGKSTYDNLQTLCHRCNVEKGDRIAR